MVISPLQDNIIVSIASTGIVLFGVWEGGIIIKKILGATGVVGGSNFFRKSDAKKVEKSQEAEIKDDKELQKNTGTEAQNIQKVAQEDKEEKSVIDAEDKIDLQITQALQLIEQDGRNAVQYIPWIGGALKTQLQYLQYEDKHVADSDKTIKDLTKALKAELKKRDKDTKAEKTEEHTEKSEKLSSKNGAEAERYQQMQLAADKAEHDLLNKLINLGSLMTKTIKKQKSLYKDHRKKIDKQIKTQGTMETAIKGNKLLDTKQFNTFKKLEGEKLGIEKNEANLIDSIMTESTQFYQLLEQLSQIAVKDEKIAEYIGKLMKPMER